jgi:hypothetical protein
MLRLAAEPKRWISVTAPPWPSSLLGLVWSRRCRSTTRLIEGLTREQQGLVLLVAVVEPVWALSSSHGLNRSQRVDALDVLLRSQAIVIDRADLVPRAQRRLSKGGADFSASRPAGSNASHGPRAARPR